MTTQMAVPFPVEDVKVVSSILYFHAQIKCILCIIIIITIIIIVMIIVIIFKNPPLSNCPVAEKCLHPASDSQYIESCVWYPVLVEWILQSG